MAQSYIEKIVQRFAVDLPSGQLVRSGDFVSIRPAHVMTHDNTGAVMNKFRAIGATRMADPRQPVFALDHNVQDTSEKNLKKYAAIESFAREMGVDFYPAGRGIGHQIMCEEGYVWPGTLVVASDSHANMYGGLGALGTPIVRTDAAAIWATGRTWWQIPKIARVVLHGKPRSGVSGKDIILALCGTFRSDEVLNHAIEFTGDGIQYLSIDQRLTIANMTTEWGALAGVFPVDERTLAWLQHRIEFVSERGPAGVPSDADGNGGHPRLNSKRLQQLRESLSQLTADPDAVYAKEIHIDLSSVTPQVAGPNSVKVTHSVAELRKEKIAVHKAYLVSCVNSRLEDLEQAAEVLRGKTVAPQVQFYVAAASREVQDAAEKSGVWQTLLDAGAIPLPPGCGPCIGLGKGLLEAGEVGISATNRNFKGRMGSPEAQAYLASPAVVAASAVSGYIDLPGEWQTAPIKGQVKVMPAAEKSQNEVQILPGFPALLEGELLFCHQDNLNTDGIYPGKYTYIDDFTPEQQAQVVMENYDPEFTKLAKEGDILVGGYNFGTGSSREQAATALKYRGIALVLAGSFSETYKRNAMNNGFLVLEAPELVEMLKKRFGTQKPTVRTGIQAKVNFRTATVEADGRVYAISPVGKAAQELVLAGGLENWVKERIKTGD